MVEGMVLGEKHWRVIAAIRERIARSSEAPSLGDVALACGLSRLEMQQLFRGAGNDFLARLAGAPELKRRETS